MAQDLALKGREKGSSKQLKNSYPDLNHAPLCVWGFNRGKRNRERLFGWRFRCRVVALLFRPWRGLYVSLESAVPTAVMGRVEDVAVHGSRMGEGVTWYE